MRQADHPRRVPAVGGARGRARARRRTLALALGATATAIASGCSSDDGTDPGGAGPASTEPAAASSTSPPRTAEAVEQRYPDILGAVATDAGDGTWSFEVTISSPYDTPERYADGWRVVGPDGTVLGEHTLTHDHAAEQPFTRRQSGVEIPADVDRVTIEGRDQQYGYGGDNVTIELER